MKTTMKKLIPLFLLVFLLPLLSYGQATPVTQSATMPNSATRVANAQAAVNNQVTATATPSGSNSIYITGVLLGSCENNTGGATTNVSFNWTAGIAGTVNGTSVATIPVWTLSQASTADLCNWKATTFSTPLKSATPGAAVSLQSPAAAAATAYTVNFFYYEGQ